MYQYEKEYECPDCGRTNDQYEDFCPYCSYKGKLYVRSYQDGNYDDCWL